MNLTTTEMGRLFAAAAMLALVGCGGATGDDATDELSELSCDYFSNNAVLPDTEREVDYLVPAGCTLKASGDNTIEAGVVLEFGSDAGLIIQGNDSIKAVGSADAPIVMRSAAQTKGAWRGVMVNSNNVNNRFDYVDISDAGGNSFNSNDDRATIILWSGSRFALTNSTLSNGAEYGVTTYGDITLEWEANTVTSHDKEPLNITAKVIHELDGASDFTGNAQDRISVFGHPLTETVSWNKLNVPYYFGPTGDKITINDSAVITIEAGTQIVFGADAGLAVEGSAALVADGTEDAPIVFTGATETPGAWRGLFFNTANTQNLLNHVEIAYAGSSAFNSNGDLGAIIVWAGSYLTVTNSIIRDAQSECGINATYNDETLVNENNTFTNITTPECQE